MAKRLSSLFSFPREDKHQLHAEGLEPVSTTSPLYSYSPTYPTASTGQKLHKLRLNPNHDPNGTSPALAPPPLLFESGVARPPSSQRSASQSRPGSRASSARSEIHSQEGSRSRPQTPTLLISTTATDSLSRPATPSAGKISKKKSWVPGKHDRNKLEDGSSPRKAWIAGLREHVPYDLAPLITGQRVGSCP